MAAQGHRAFIGLGSNLEGPLGLPGDYIETALGRLAAEDELQVLRRSGLYRSEPWGMTEQADFVNAVVEIATSLGAEELLDRLLAIEAGLGRRRLEKWGPRLIDLDLLSFDDLEMDGEELSLPHPRMHERAFVLAPLLEIDPGFVIPGKGRASGFLDAIGQEQRVIRL